MNQVDCVEFAAAIKNLVSVKANVLSLLTLCKLHQSVIFFNYLVLYHKVWLRTLRSHFWNLSTNHLPHLIYPKLIAIFTVTVTFTQSQNLNDLQDIHCLNLSDFYVFVNFFNLTAPFQSWIS